MITTSADSTLPDRSPTIAGDEDQADTDRDPPGPAEAGDDRDVTMELGAVELGSVLPFRPAVDRTLEVPYAPPAAPVLPFTPPSPDCPRRRLHRFDPQTGRPLVVPVWVDEVSVE